MFTSGITGKTPSGITCVLSLWSTSTECLMPQDIQTGHHFQIIQQALKIHSQIINKTCKSRMHEDLDIEASVDELNDLEEKFANIVKERVAANPELK